MAIDSEALVEFGLARLKEDVLASLGNAVEVPESHEGSSTAEETVRNPAMLDALFKLSSDCKVLEENFNDAMKALRVVAQENCRLRDSAHDAGKLRADLLETRKLLTEEIIRSRKLEGENESLWSEKSTLLSFLRNTLLTRDENAGTMDVLVAHVEALSTENTRLRDIIKEIRRVETMVIEEESSGDIVDPASILVTPPRSPESHASRLRSLQTPTSSKIEIDITDLGVGEVAAELADVGRVVSPGKVAGSPPVIAVALATVSGDLADPHTDRDERVTDAELNASIEFSSFDSL